MNRHTKKIQEIQDQAWNDYIINDKSEAKCRQQKALEQAIQKMEDFRSSEEYQNLQIGALDQLSQYMNKIEFIRCQSWEEYTPEALIHEVKNFLKAASEKNQNLQKRIDGCSDLLNRIKLFNDPALDQYIEKIQGIQAQAWKDLGNPVVLISSEFEQNDHGQYSQSQMTIQKELNSQSFQFNPQDLTMSAEVVKKTSSH